MFCCNCTSLAAPSKSHIEFSGRSDQVTALFYRGMFTRETVKHLCQMMPSYRVFVFAAFLFLSIVINFDKKCANSTQRSQSLNSHRLTIVYGKSKIYPPRQRYLSPGNSIVLVIAATLLFISVTIFCRFWGSFC